MDVLEKLQSRHEKRTEKPVLDREMPSDPQADADDPVAILTKYLKSCEGFGLFLEKSTIPVLRFTPGVSPQDGERWNQARHADMLLAEAYNDLMESVRRRRIELLPHPGYK